MSDAKQSDEPGRKSDHGSLPVIEETLQLDKRVIDKGRTRIIKKVEEETVEVPLVSRTTAYSVERIPMNQYVEKAPPAIRHDGNTMILSILQEEVFVQKRLKVVEELRITLKENETITHTAAVLKKERVIIEKDQTNSQMKTKNKIMAQTVIGIFNDSNAAQGAVQRLTAYGFTDSDIDVSSSGYAAGSGGNSDKSDHSDDGFGERVSRFFKNLFDDEDDVQRYSTLARQGTVVSVYASSREEAERAADIMDEYGAVNVNEQGAGYEPTTASGTNLSDSQEDRSNRSIPVIEEDVRVGKREVEKGGKRLRSRIIERPVEENLRLRSEHVTIDRTPANRPASEADMNAFREGEIEVRERAEVPVVNKQAHVVEEINVRKDVEEREEVVRETARKTDVQVENLDTTAESSGKSRSKRKI